MRRYQILIPDKRDEQLEFLAEKREVQPATMLRLLVMDGIEAAIKKLRDDYPLYRDDILAIEVKYSARS